MSNDERFDVQSVDGTPIAVWVEGKGPPVVLVHGPLSDHTTFALLINELRDRMTGAWPAQRSDHSAGWPRAHRPSNDPAMIASVIWNFVSS